jgi:hypothetical protein
MLSRQVATGDLDRFRESFRRLERRLEEASRADRYKPPTGLATARLHLESMQPTEGLSA